MTTPAGEDASGQAVPGASDHKSQFGQDRFLDEQVFHGRRGGVFVEVGAFDGVTLSNTWFFEHRRGWSGVCVEPQPAAFERLQRERSCVCVRAAVAARPGRARFLEIQGTPTMLSGLVDAYHRKHRARIRNELRREGGRARKIRVDCLRLADLLREHGIASVDYLSLDTEGGELEILRSLPFDELRIDVIGVEENYDAGAIGSFLATQGYAPIAELGCDRLYRRRP